MKIIKWVLRSNQIYWGDFVGDFPDMLIGLNEPYTVKLELSEDIEGNIDFGKDRFAQHYKQGIFLGKGPGIKHLGEIKPGNVWDITPTILYDLGMDYDSKRFDGMERREIFR